MALLLYYGFARHLPAYSNPVGLKVGTRLRQALCRHIFSQCGRNVNIEKGVWFGLGDTVRIGSGSGIGINARLYGRGKITMGENILMGPDVVILTENHGS